MTDSWLELRFLPIEEWSTKFPTDLGQQYAFSVAWEMKEFIELLNELDVPPEFVDVIANRSGVFSAFNASDTNRQVDDKGNVFRECLYLSHRSSADKI